MKLLKHTYNSLGVIGEVPQSTNPNQPTTPPSAETVLSQINEINECYERRNYRNFANYAKYLIWQDVSAIVSNIVISCDNPIGEPIALAVMHNANFIFSKLSANGYVWANRENGVLVFRTTKEKKDDFQIFDLTYQRNNITRDGSSAQILAFIDDLENAQNTLINQAEASDIFTPKELVVNGSAREKSVSEKFRKLFGIKRGQQKTAFLEIPMEHHAIGRYDYKIDDKIKFQFQKLCKLYMFPEDLFFASTTFNNKSESRLQLCYNYAGYFYEILQQILNSTVTGLTMNDFAIEFYNIREWDEASKKRVEAKREEIKFLLELKAAGYSVDDKIEAIFKTI